MLVGISGRELGRRCGIAEGTVNNVELGRHGVTPELMRKMADVLGVPLDAITSTVPAKRKRRPKRKEPVVAAERAS